MKRSAKRPVTPFLINGAERWWLSMGVGLTFLTVGAVATLVSIFDPPADRIERLAAAGTGSLSLAVGITCASLALPRAWKVPTKLWRYAGWLIPFALAPLAVLMRVFPNEAAERASSARFRTDAAAVVYGLGLTAASFYAAKYWLADLRRDRTRDDPDNETLSS